MTADRDDPYADDRELNPKSTNHRGDDSPRKRALTGAQSGLLSALGPGAVNRRVQGRILHSTATATPHGSDIDVLKRLTLRLDQIFAGLLSYDQVFLDMITKRLIRDEVPFSAFYRQVSVPLAEMLGDAWNDDTLSMVDVEFASGRLALWCDKYASEDVLRHSGASGKRRIFLARTAGEKHTLGLSITGKCYRHAGWRVDGGAHVEAGSALLMAVRDTYYDVVGVSVGASHRAFECSVLVQDIRSASCNANLKIVLGGPALIAEPHVFDHVGADFIALDAMEAVEMCDQFVRAA